MSVAYGKAFVGRTVKINAEYFEDVSSVDVDSDFEYTAKIKTYDHRGGGANRTWIFTDHDGCENGMTFEELQRFLVDSADEGGRVRVAH